MSEFMKVVMDRPQYVFNDVPAGRKKDKILVQVETMNIIPDNFSVENIRLYGGVATWNRKIFPQLQTMGANAVLIPGFPLFDNYYNLTEFLPTEQKDGVSIVCRYRPKSPIEYDIAHKRVDVFMNLKGMNKYAYGKVPYADEFYRGVIGGTTEGTYPSSLDKLKTLNKHRFSVCFENAYHPLWSWDYITEKILDCFKAKTIPIYLGCFNIEQHIPKELFIDYRDFKSDHQLSDYLNSFDMTKYDEMVDKAYEWQKTFRWGRISDMVNTLDTFYNKTIKGNV